MQNIQNYIKETIITGQDLLRNIYIIENTTNFEDYFIKIKSLKEMLKSYGIDSEVYEEIKKIPQYESKKYKINFLQKIFYLLAFFRLTMNRILIRNNETHRIKRYILQTNMTLDYINKFIIK